MKNSRGVRVAQLKKVPYFNFVKIRIRELSDGEHIPRLGVVHVDLPPRYEHVPVCHRRTREWMLILKGRGRGVIGGRLVRFKPGTTLYMPPGVYHQMSTGAGRLEALVLFSPPLRVRDRGADICYPKKRSSNI